MTTFAFALLFLAFIWAVAAGNRDARRADRRYASLMNRYTQTSVTLATTAIALDGYRAESLRAANEINKLMVALVCEWRNKLQAHPDRSACEIAAQLVRDYKALVIARIPLSLVLEHFWEKRSEGLMRGGALEDEAIKLLEAYRKQLAVLDNRISDRSEFESYIAALDAERQYFAPGAHVQDKNGTIVYGDNHRVWFFLRLEYEKTGAEPHHRRALYTKVQVCLDDYLTEGEVLNKVRLASQDLRSQLMLLMETSHD